jgi:hypothetical protein
MSVATAKMETSKEMENKMEKTFTELHDEIVASLKAEHPNEDLGMTYARFLGLLLAHADRETLSKILENRKKVN